MVQDSEETVPPSWVRRMLIGRSPKRTLVRMAITVIVLLAVGKLLLVPVRVEGISMLTTYKENGINVVNRMAFLFHNPRRGDVVAIRIADEHILFPHILYLKRVIALPGETIAFRNGQVLINGQVLDEPYLKLRGRWTHEPEEVGPDEYFVVGDNRAMNWNDHEKGRASRRQILGKILW
jgi:signal peptidase I